MAKVLQNHKLIKFLSDHKKIDLVSIEKKTGRIVVTFSPSFGASDVDDFQNDIGQKVKLVMMKGVNYGVLNRYPVVDEGKTVARKH